MKYCSISASILILDQMLSQEKIARIVLININESSEKALASLMG